MIYPAMGCTVRSELAVGLGATCDPNGYVRVNEREETSVHGIFAAGDLTAPAQAATLAAAAGVRAAWAINHELNVR